MSRWVRSTTSSFIHYVGVMRAHRPLQLHEDSLGLKHVEERESSSTVRLTYSNSAWQTLEQNAKLRGSDSRGGQAPELVAPVPVVPLANGTVVRQLVLVINFDPRRPSGRGGPRCTQGFST